MLIAVAPAKLLTIAMIMLLGASFCIATGLVMAVTGKPVPWLPAGQAVPPDRLRPAAAGVTLLGVGVALLAAGIYTAFGNVASVPFFLAGLAVLLVRPTGGGSKWLALVGFVLMLAWGIFLMWALPMWLRN